MEKNQPNTKRNLISFVIYGILTLGIYDIIVLTKIGNEVNLITKNENNNTWLGKSWPFYLIVLLVFFTLGIASIIWFENLSIKIGLALKSRQLPFNLSMSTFWGWFFLGRLILIGPFVYFNKLLKAMNVLNEDYYKN